MSNDNKEKNKNLIIGVLAGLVVFLIIFIIITPMAKSDESYGETTDKETEVEQASESNDTVTEEVAFQLDEAPLTASLETGRDYPYPYNDAEIDFEIPSLTEIRALVAEESLNRGSEMNPFEVSDFLVEEYPDNMIGVMAAGGELPSEDYSDSIQDVLLDRTKYRLFDPHGGHENMFSLGDLSPFETQEAAMREYMRNQGDLPNIEPTLIEVTDGFSLEETSYTVHANDLTIGGFHVNHTSIDGLGINGLDLSALFNLNVMHGVAEGEVTSWVQEQRPDAAHLLESGILSKEELTRVTFFVRPSRPMNGIELIERAHSIPVAINGENVSGTPAPSSESYADAYEFFGFGDMVMIGEETADKRIDKALTVIESGVVVIQQYIDGHVLDDDNNVLTFGGKDFPLQDGNQNKIDLSQFIN